MYTPEEIIQFQADARKWQMRYPAEFMDYPPEKIAGIANGYGPDRWPEPLRDFISWIFRHYPIPGVIHDLRYELSDGASATRHAADAEFAANLQINYRQRYGWSRYINPVAWYAKLKIKLAGDLTCKYGREAWLDAACENGSVTGDEDDE